LSNNAHLQLPEHSQDDRELEQARVKEEEEGAFSPSDLEDARRRILAGIVLRQGQRGFRERLLTAYQRSCAVTGCDVVEALEVAHIIAYLGPETNYVTNDLLLRADIHTLFDLWLIVVQPNDYRVIVSKRLRGTSYESLAGQVIRLPADHVDHPSRQALEQRTLEFQSKESGRMTGRRDR
jgi:putative restriction endonuclease